MLRVSKTSSNVSIYLLLITLIPIMIIGIFMIALKSLMFKGYELLWKLGTWLQQVSEASLDTIKGFGWTVSTICLVFYIILIINLILINSRRGFIQRIGFAFGVAIGLCLFIIAFLPLMAKNSIKIDPSLIELIFGLLLATVGLHSIVLLIGSTLGLIFAKTSIDYYETKKVKIEKKTKNLTQ
ncbi:hypothetical protein [Spiroplasma floricola]|uniref:Uncharacterized protein n=1 Tax=Spiroplasma floricola 23-6 TaxID=1336749 RepID=A0A2K8SFU8_9MOLU|nr:hypothetical protein [Spiroplasma floricola]AUB31700.1 hypothetical protein SFLOR_v1c06500 [Spiroplasma floricola 23-6]